MNCDKNENFLILRYFFLSREFEGKKSGLAKDFKFIMKLYLHNFLQDNTNGQIHYPLKIVPTEVKEAAGEYNQEMMESFVKRIDFIALASACKDLGKEFEAPEDIDHIEEEQLRVLHHLLFEIEVVSGALVSPSGKQFPIISGIPDMSPEIGAAPPESNENAEEEQAEQE